MFDPLCICKPFAEVFCPNFCDLVQLRSTGPPRSLASLYGKLNCLPAKWDLFFSGG